MNPPGDGEQMGYGGGLVGGDWAKSLSFFFFVRSEYY
jgi:hypothetical protein